MGEGGGGLAFAAGAVVQGERGRFSSGAALTDQQAAFVRAFLRNGGKAREAAEAAGYGDPLRAGWSVQRNPAVVAAIREGLEREGLGLAAAVIRKARTVLDEDQPLTAPAMGLVRTALEAGQAIGRRQAGEKDNGNKTLADMSLRDLGTDLAAQQEALATLRALLAQDAPGSDRKPGRKPPQVIDI